MRVTILGCGEAFDDRFPNTSMLVEAAGQTILCDCGFSVPRQLWGHVPDPNAIDTIYISHPHADHYFGLPAVLGRMWEDGREKPLTVLSQPAVLDQIRDLAEYGYRTLPARFKYQISWEPAAPDKTVELGGIEFAFAPTLHSVTNLAVRMRAGGRTFCYSGDGMFTPESRRLFSDADLVVHEAYWFDPSPVHADIPRLLEMASGEGIAQLALVHVQRGLRREPARILDAIADTARGIEASLPEPLAHFML